jgi:menaquinone-9 beta-reductase
MVIPNRADVVVIGGGPAGSSTATHLARAGVDVVLLDQARFPREKPCAEYCSPGVVDAIADLGALDSLTANAVQRLERMNIVTPDTKIPLDFAGNRPGGNPALGIKRSVLDHHLLEFAAGHGGQVFDGTRVLRPVREGNEVVGVRYRSGSDEGVIHARFVVAADGLHSTFSRSLGLDRPVRWPNRLGLVARFEGADTSDSSGEMHVAGDRYCGFSPVDGGIANVSLVVKMGAKPNNVATGAFFESQVRSIPGIARRLAHARRITKVRGMGPMARRVSRRAGNGYLLVGDAAGFFDPLTGEGVHRALRGGELAAAAALRALERDDRYPVCYEASRKRAFGEKERVCQIIQVLLFSRHAVAYAAHRAKIREDVNDILCGVLGDYTPARTVLRPSFIWSLFRP